MTKKENILFVTQWQFNDALIQTYTLPYIKIIKDLDVFESYQLVVFNKSIKTINTFQWEGIQIVELPYEYITFKSFLSIYLAIKKIVDQNQITHLHPWCTTAGTFGLLLKKFHNRELHLVIDSFEPHAETMIENGEWKKTSFKFKFLMWCEKMQAIEADRLIFAADGMQNYIKEKYGVQIDKYDVKPACVDLELFKPSKERRVFYRNEFNLNDKIVCVYAGKLGGIYLDKEIFLFVKQCVLFWGDKFRFLLLSTMSDQELNEQCSRYQIPVNIFEKRFVPHQQVAGILNAADFGICPVKPIRSKRYCSPIKNGEYWATGLPVVITDQISTDSELIESKKIGAVWKQLNQTEFERSINLINTLLSEDQEALKANIREVAIKNRSFEIAKHVYRKIYYICKDT